MFMEAMMAPVEVMSPPMVIVPLMLPAESPVLIAPNRSWPIWIRPAMLPFCTVMLPAFPVTCSELAGPKVVKVPLMRSQPWMTVLRQPAPATFTPGSLVTDRTAPRCSRSLGGFRGTADTGIHDNRQTDLGNQDFH